MSAYTLDPLKSEWADYAAVQAECGNLAGNELTLSLSGITWSQWVSTCWATVDWSWPKEWKAQAGNELSNILPKSSHLRKKPSKGTITTKPTVSPLMQQNQSQESDSSILERSSAKMASSSEGACVLTSELQSESGEFAEPSSAVISALMKALMTKLTGMSLHAWTIYEQTLTAFFFCEGDHLVSVWVVRHTFFSVCRHIHCNCQSKHQPRSGRHTWLHCTCELISTLFSSYPSQNINMEAILNETGPRVIWYQRCS